MHSRMILLPLLALGVAAYFWLTTEPASSVPAATWRIGKGTEIRQGQNYDELSPESLIRLSVVCNEPRHLYVFSNSAEDGTVLMFPSPAVDADASNPLPAGRTVLPGKREGEEVAWTSRSGIAAVTTFVAIASSEPIPELESLLPKLRHWTNTVFPDHSMAITQLAENAEVLGKPGAPIPSTLIRLAADIGNTEPNPNGPMKPAEGRPGVFTSSWKIRERKAGPGAKPGGEKK